MGFWAEVRERLQLTRYAMARKLGLKQGSWDNLEQQGGRPSLELLVKIKKLTSLTGNELFELMERSEAKPQHPKNTSEESRDGVTK